jgi:phosphoribosylanthranilate isomerase
LDAHAPGIYGGTGEVFDWKVASDFRHRNPHLAVILAGGITPENAELAAMSVQPAALDIASGAEISPGIKDFQKVTAFLSSLHRRSTC